MEVPKPVAVTEEERIIDSLPEAMRWQLENGGIVILEDGFTTLQDLSAPPKFQSIRASEQ